MRNPIQISRSFIVPIFSLFVIALTSFSAQAIDAKEALTGQLEKHKGEVVYLDFWASWCVPCRKSFPWMVEMQSKYKQDGFTVISINVDANKALADEFLKESPSNFPVIYDPKGELASEFKLKGMPSSYVFNRAGKIVKAHTGFFRHKKVEYEEELISLIFESSPITNTMNK